MFFSAITTNLNWKTLTKNLVTFKSWDGVKDENFKYYEGSLKNLTFRGGWGHEKPLYREELPQKGGGLGQFADLTAGALAKKRVVLFLRGQVDTPMHAMHLPFFFSLFLNFTLSFQGFLYEGDRGRSRPH